MTDLERQIKRQKDLKSAHFWWRVSVILFILWVVFQIIAAIQRHS